MQYIKYILALFFQLILFVEKSNSQIPLKFRYFSVSKLGTEEGLSQGSNYFRYEDNLGYMWITANDAINRWDGLNIKVYKSNHYFKNCALLRQGYNFVEDYKNDIYIGSTAGLYQFHRKLNIFTTITIFDSLSTITIPIAVNNGKLWCYNNKYQIASYDLKSKEIRHYEGPKMLPMVGTHAYNLAQGTFFYKKSFIDKAGNIWLANNTTLAAFNYKNNTSKFFLTDQVTNQTYSDGLGFKIENKIESFVYRETDQTIMLGTSNGLIHFNMISQKATYIPTIKDVKLNWVREICLYKNDFLCMTQKGLIIYNTNEKNAFYFKENLSKSTFSFNPINIGVDKSDRIWLCKIGEGFRILDFKNKPFYKEGTSADTGYLPPGRIMGMAELPNHEILISVGKVKVIQNNISRNIRTIKSDGTIESYNDILIADSFRNVVWKCGYNKLMYYHPISQKNTEVIFKNRGTGSVPVTNHLVPISKNEILLAGSGGLYQYIEAKKVFTPIESLPNKMAFYINPISNNRFLISYLNEEMLLVKKNENQSYSVEKKILPGVFPFYVWEDVIKKQFWLASNIGLFITDEKFKIIKKIDENNGLAGAYIYGLLSDDIGNIWVSHGHGISSIDKSTFKITNYGKEDGLQDWDFNNRSFLKTSDGTLYFGGVNGFNYFKPPLQQNQFYKPLLYIDAINYEQKPYLQDTNFNLVNKVRLNAGIQNIEIKVNIASLDAASSYQIIYRIKNKNVKWTYITNPANISLYNLAPGTYILEMGVYDKFSKIEQLQKEVVIEIIPFFYQTNWFWIIVGFFISCIIFWIITNQRLIKQKRKYEQQLSLEIEKKRISNDLHDDIGASISS
ncbi:MAG: hypothetical protein KA319_09540, partial [Ferruginibacter sp.]|nr:hypothetical protein [Ferruginibacter sp.]